MKTKHVILVSGMMMLGACNSGTKLVYPVAEKDGTIDTYFGTEVADPYRWLENDTSKATEAWVEAENKITAAYLSEIPFRTKVRQRLTDLTNYEKIGTPYKKKGKYYFFKNDGLQNQNVLYVKETLNGEARVLLDPNKLSEDGTVALSGISFSHDGKYLAYNISRSGSDWNEIYIIDLTTGSQLNDAIQWAKFSGASWQGNGFYYSAYDAPEAGKEYSNMNENHKIYYHTLGTSQNEDQLVYRNPAEPKRFYYGDVSEDERILFIYESGAGSGNNLFMKDLTKNVPVTALTHDMEYSYSPIEVIDNKIYLITNYGAPRYRIMTATVSSPKLEEWKELIPESESVLAGASIIGGKLILTYEKDASHHAYVYTLDGKQEHEVKLPTLGSVHFSGDKDDKETFYSFSSFTFPPTIYTYDTDKNESNVYLAPKVAFNPDDYTTEQVFYPSKDGTQIPMFLTYKKELQKNGSNPVLLYGYGGFNISLSPGFSTNRLVFLENGGIYAQANLRGGSEYGEEWHQAGTKMNKQHVFDDFIAAAEYLIKENYTNKEKLAVNGGSNGGLLVGAVVNQRPDLFKVAVPAVGVMDMLRYHKFTIGWNWASDYGTSEDNADMFAYLYAYSPLHNIKNDGTPYPALLITTADHDDRVVPAHSFKYAATLQAANTGNAPKLIRIETKAGHGAGKPISKVIDEYTDVYSFIMYNLGINL
ncbi:MAG: prolyl oligopeptidase family serine peptidase [Tannerellaceae bacterium]|jgi:prolyl oligopeptidase|nr:prolyl oligopeptidase family serine peptidase [Tannerellaceae bacterium]